MSTHLWWSWVQGWWRGDKFPLFWGCEQLRMLKSYSLTPTLPRARDLGGKPTRRGWGRRNRAAGSRTGPEGLMGSVCSRSLVTKEKGTALGKETKHPLPRRVISFSTAKGSSAGTVSPVSLSWVAESKWHRVSVADGGVGWGHSLGQLPVTTSPVSPSPLFLHLLPVLWQNVGDTMCHRTEHPSLWVQRAVPLRHEGGLGRVAEGAVWPGH